MLQELMILKYFSWTDSPNWEIFISQLVQFFKLSSVKILHTNGHSPKWQLEMSVCKGPKKQPTASVISVNTGDKEQTQSRRRLGHDSSNMIR